MSNHKQRNLTETTKQSKTQNRKYRTKQSRHVGINTKIAWIKEYVENN